MRRTWTRTIARPVAIVALTAAIAAACGGGSDGGGNDSNGDGSGDREPAPTGAPGDVTAGERDDEPAPADFLEAAASTCTEIATRRAGAGYSTDLVLEAVIAYQQAKPLAADAALVAELTVLVAEWQQTVADFEAVPTANVTDATEWQTTIDAATERVTVYEQRLAALSSGDADEIATWFRLGVITIPGPGDWVTLGLGIGDCPTLSF